MPETVTVDRGDLERLIAAAAAHASAQRPGRWEVRSWHSWKEPPFGGGPGGAVSAEVRRLERAIARARLALASETVGV